MEVGEELIKVSFTESFTLYFTGGRNVFPAKVKISLWIDNRQRLMVYEPSLVFTGVLFTRELCVH